MEKSSILESYRAILLKQIASQEEVLRETTAVARDAPGANVTHSDTSRFQLSNQRLGQERILETTRGYLSAITDGEKECSVAGPGALVCLEDEEGEQSHFLILRQANGTVIEAQGEKITAVSAQAPFPKAMLKKTLNDEFEFRGKIYFVVDVS